MIFYCYASQSNTPMKLCLSGRRHSLQVNRLLLVVHPSSHPDKFDLRRRPSALASAREENRGEQQHRPRHRHGLVAPDRDQPRGSRRSSDHGGSGRPTDAVMVNPTEAAPVDISPPEPPRTNLRRTVAQREPSSPVAMPSSSVTPSPSSRSVSSPTSTQGQSDPNEQAQCKPLSPAAMSPSSPVMPSPLSSSLSRRRAARVDASVTRPRRKGRATRTSSHRSVPRCRSSSTPAPTMPRCCIREYVGGCARASQRGGLTIVPSPLLPLPDDQEARALRGDGRRTPLPPGQSPPPRRSPILTSRRIRPPPPSLRACLRRPARCPAWRQHPSVILDVVGRLPSQGDIPLKPPGPTFTMPETTTSLTHLRRKTPRRHARRADHRGAGRATAAAEGALCAGV